MIFKPFDVVVVPFPFTDRSTSKRRPALVLSNADGFNHKIGHCLLTMITSSQQSSWPLDTKISDLNSAGLTSPSLVRMKLFTLDNKLIIRKAGNLAPQDQSAVRRSLAELLPDLKE